ncbi:MAG: hypothetical protein KAI79_03620 [Bacteroidales bacterium]|nr:hypothetical protein [Bacteroidales bacterium]
MQKYINQLLGDLKAACKNVPPKPDFGNTQKEFNVAMDSIVHAPEQEPKKNFGVSYQELPPPERITDKQMQQIVDAMTNTFNAFGMSVHLKSEMPTNLQYELLRDLFLDNMPYMPGWNFDFCDGHCPKCKILDYCDSWKDTWTIEEIKKEQEKY